MAWELATFSADLLPSEPEASRARRWRSSRRAQPVRVTHVLDAVEPRIRPDGRAAFPTEGSAGRGGRTGSTASSSSPASTSPARSGRFTSRSRSSISPGRAPRSRLSPTMTCVVLTFSRARRRPRGDRRAGARRRRSPSRRSSPAATLDAEPDEVERFELGPADGEPAGGRGADPALRPRPPLQPVRLRDAGRARRASPHASIPPRCSTGRSPAASTTGRPCGTRRSSSSATPSSAASTAEHGKTLRFAGVVLMRGYEQSRRRQAARGRARQRRVARELGADGVVITTDAGGNSHTDVMLTCRACEQAGIRTTVVLAEETDPESTRPILTDWVPEADSIVSTGNVEELVEEWTARARARRRHAARLDGAPAAEAGPIPVRNYLGAANQMGQLALGARTE